MHRRTARTEPPRKRARRTLPDRGPKPRVAGVSPALGGCSRRGDALHRAGRLDRTPPRRVGVDRPSIWLLSFVVSTSSFSSVCQERQEQSGCHRTREISDRNRRVSLAMSRCLQPRGGAIARHTVAATTRWHRPCAPPHMRVASGSRLQARGFTEDLGLVAVWYGSCARDHPCDSAAARRPRGGACRSGPSSPPKGACISACGRPGSAESRWRAATSGCRWRRSPGGTTPAGCRRSERARGTRSGSTAAHPTPIPPLDSSPRARTGRSEVIDPNDFAWTDVKWRGVPREGQVVYEMHIGTFTTAGTWRRRQRGAAGAGPGRHHRRGGDASRGLLRRLRLGL